jgi:protein-tyrosine-phosphatase/DNA-binding transcriptional ArsR family regulator
MGATDAPAPPPFLRLISHPLRWRLVIELARSDLRVRELIRGVDQPQNLVSYHLRLLRIGGLVTSRRSSYDARDSYYHLDLDRCAEGLTRTGAALHPALHMIAAPKPATARPRVLFVCTGNSARSPIAEALLRHRAGEQVRVSSAGTHPKDHIHPQAIRILRERYNIDIEGQTPRSLDPERGRQFDRVITVCDKAREALPDAEVWPLAHWSIADPAAGIDSPTGYPKFESAVADIDARVRHLIPTLGATPRTAATAIDNKEEQP